MAKFIIKDVELVPMAYEYEVEAKTQEEALELYVNRLAGSLEIHNQYVTDGKAGITVRPSE